jgi:DNA gyrase subunit A
MATGVRVHRIDEDDAIAAVALVPPSAEEADEGIVEVEE